MKRNSVCCTIKSNRCFPEALLSFNCCLTLMFSNNCRCLFHNKHKNIRCLKTQARDYGKKWRQINIKTRSPHINSFSLTYTFTVCHFLWCLPGLNVHKSEEKWRERRRSCQLPNLPENHRVFNFSSVPQWFSDRCLNIHEFTANRS